MNWHIGQEIVCVKSHSQGYVTCGKIYTINGLQKSMCKCNDVDIDVGITTNNTRFACGGCEARWLNNAGVVWISETLFAPLEYNQDAINELLEEPVTVSK